MSNSNKRQLNAQIYEEASEWLVEFRAGDLDASGRREFSEWVRKSPEHVRAYLEIAAIWNEGPAFDVERRYGNDELIALADEGIVVPLSSSARVQPSPAPEPSAANSTVARRFAVAAIALIAVGALLSWLYLNQGIYRTGVGEQRSLVLADGSMLQLNSRSKLRVRFGDARRSVELLEGQALFNVAKDAKRPFVVASENMEVRAIGTQFDVYRRATGTTVTVVEGQVEVLPESTRLIASAALLLAAGEQATVAPGALARPRQVNVAAVTAWTQRQIVFDSATLADVALEFNRYNSRQIVLAEPEMTEFHISGVFSSTDPSSLIRFLRERPGIVVLETDSEVRISRR